MSTSFAPSTVTVLGLGPMGRSLARAFLAAGLRTIVWNRTPGRDHELTGLGAAGAASPEEAVAASDPIIVCVVLRRRRRDPARRGGDPGAEGPYRRQPQRRHPRPGPEHGRLGGRPRHPLPRRSDHDAAPGIGTPDAVFLHSGPEEVFQEQLPRLEALGGTHTHLGEEIGRAATFDIALLDIFWTATAGYAHAVALARAEGVTARELAPFAQGIGAILPPLFAEFAEDADSGSFSGAINPLTSAVSTMAHVVAVSEAHGIDAGVMRAAEGMARRVIGLGHGTDGFIRVAEVLGRH